MNDTSSYSVHNPYFIYLLTRIIYYVAVTYMHEPLHEYSGTGTSTRSATAVALLRSGGRLSVYRYTTYTTYYYAYCTILLRIDYSLQASSRNRQ